MSSTKVPLGPLERLTLLVVIPILVACVSIVYLADAKEIVAIAGVIYALAVLIGVLASRRR